MQNSFSDLSLLSPWIIIPLVYFLWVSVLSIVKRIVFSTIKRFAERTVNHWDDIFCRAADFPLTLLIFTSGGLLVEHLLPEGGASLTNAFLLGFKAATIVAVILFADRFVSELIAEYSHQVEVLKVSSDVVQVITRIIVFSLGLLILLDSFGISITPIIASLGIGSLAVALALQPTLENLFSGAQLIFDKSIQVGHFVKLESGEEGYVHKIGWRSSWIRLPPNNMVIIPNKIIVNSRVLNYHYPDKELAVPIEVGVHYNSDLEQVEKITLEVARQTLKEVSGGVASFEPAVRYHALADFSVNMTVALRAKEISDVGLLRHEFIKRLHQRYAKEGIIIPYPVQAVNYSQENSSLAVDELMEKGLLKENGKRKM
jgi:small-conductance mechanosensitive channel